MFRQNTSSPKTWSLTCCKKWTWRRDASKFGELTLWVACSTKTLLTTRIKAFHIFPHTAASNVVFRQKYVLSEKDYLRPVIKIVHKYLMPQNYGNILFHLPTIQKHLYQTYLKHIVFHLKWDWSRTLIIKQPIFSIHDTKFIIRIYDKLCSTCQWLTKWKTILFHIIWIWNMK